MSGVEAIVGVVASGAGLASLALQLIDTAQKLEQFYQSAKSAPKTVTNLIFDLKTMSLSLRQLEEHRQCDSHSAQLLDRCIDRCRQCTAEIVETVAKMDRYLDKFSLGKVYVAFKEKRMEKLIVELEQAKSSLQLAYMMYLGEAQRQRDEINRRMLACQEMRLEHIAYEVQMGNSTTNKQLTLLLSAPAGVISRRAHEDQILLDPSSHTSSTQNEVHRRTDHRKKQNDRRVYGVTLAFPRWLSTRVWDFAVVHAEGGWNVPIRTYNIRSSSDDVFGRCIAGTVDELVELLQNKTASILDCSEYGDTLLEVSALGANTDVCRFLLSKIAWPESVMMLAMAAFLDAAEEYREEAYRMIVEEYDLIIDMKDPLRPQDLQTVVDKIWLGCCDSKCRKILTRNLARPLHHCTTQERFDLACSLGPGSFERPSELLDFLGLEAADPQLSTLRATKLKGASILHIVANFLGNSIEKENRRLQNEWANFGDSIIRHQTVAQITTSINLFRPYFATPLITGVTYSYGRSGKAASAVNFVRLWAAIVQRSGIDLMRYGQRESRMWVDHPFKKISLTSGHFSNSDSWNSLKQLVFGPTPDHWSLRGQRTVNFDVFELSYPPGSFPVSPNIPTRICWQPNEQEEEEGNWSYVEEKEAVSTPFDVLEPNQSPDPIDTLEITQDDTGMAARLASRFGRTRNVTTRSSSQPPLVEGRRFSYYTKQTSKNMPWLPSHHLCLIDSKYALACRAVVNNPYFLKDDSAFPSNTSLVNPRDCLSAMHNSDPDLYQTPNWQFYSWLGEIFACRSAYASPSSIPSALRHTFTEDCPQGCNSVDIERLIALMGR